MTYVIGDVHGMLDPLIRLLDALPLRSGDGLVFLGDYIDRGPASREVVELVSSLSRDRDVVFLRGNHEEMLLSCVERGEDCLTWEFNGAGATVRSFGGVEKIREYLPFFRSTRYYHEIGRYVMVHGGVRPGVPLEDQDPWDLIWIRDEFIFSTDPLPGRVVVFGHTPFEKPLVMKDKIGIDTGCVYGGHLTALRLEDLEIYTVPCRGS